MIQHQADVHQAVAKGIVHVASDALLLGVKDFGAPFEQLFEPDALKRRGDGGSKVAQQTGLLVKGLGAGREDELSRANRGAIEDKREKITV
jgi:hypothetical protein